MRKDPMLNDTIVAISTPYGESGIGIVRLSGKNSFRIANQMFLRKDQKGIYDFKDHGIHYGWIIDPKSGQIIDEVLISIFKKPRTYTKEDMIEINCHGGWAALNRAMDVTVALGARIAMPGEFTKRAFLNGRIDLIQAEAILDIVWAKTEVGLTSAMNHLRGSITKRIEDIRREMITFMAINDAKIEFEDQVEIDTKEEEGIIVRLIKEINVLVQAFDQAVGRREGIKTVFCGKVNVGKSSIINTIYGEERVLTSSIAGTTRDSIQMDIYLNGTIYHLMDTAGLKQGRTLIEKLSVQNSQKEILDSDCIIMVFDLSKRLDAQDKKIVSWIKGLNKDVIWVANKKDLPERIDLREVNKIIGGEGIFKISAKNGNGIDMLLEELKGKRTLISKNYLDGFNINKRQRGHLNRVKEALERIKGIRKEKNREEFISEELKGAINELDKITGIKRDHNVIEEIFEEFCIGK